MKPSDSQQSTATGWTWASRISAIGLEFSLPALAGWWVDTIWSLRPMGVVTGATLGFIIGILHLLKISKAGRSG